MLPIFYNLHGLKEIQFMESSSEISEPQLGSWREPTTILDFIREVNKNNLLGEQFLHIFAQKSGKIINWVGSLQAPSIFERFNPNNVFSPETLR